MKSQSIILTTHSMEECEALCQKIGILIEGKLKCLGTSQQIKSKYDNSIQLELTFDNLESLYYSNLIFLIYIN